MFKNDWNAIKRRISSQHLRKITKQVNCYWNKELFRLYFLTFNDLLKWISLGDSLASWEIFLLNCHFERSVTSACVTPVALIYVQLREFENVDVPQISRIFSMLSNGRGWRDLAVNHPLASITTVKGAGPRLREMKFLDCCWKSRSCSEITTDFRSYVL